MIFKIAATIAILGWIIGNIWWHVVKDPWATGITFQEGFSGRLFSGRYCPFDGFGHRRYSRADMGDLKCAG